MKNTLKLIGGIAVIGLGVLLAYGGIDMINRYGNYDDASGSFWLLLGLGTIGIGGWLIWSASSLVRGLPNKIDRLLNPGERK